MGLSPMMAQYLEIKEQNKDSLLFFRLGDFYEMFYDDAITASRELELTLTSRDCGLSERAPMCGVPHHAVEAYLTKLIQKGYKVTICEQVTPPNKKGIIKREVTRVVTPGTVTESSMLTEDRNNYLASICCFDNGVGVSWADISTGEFNHAFIDGQIAVKLNDLLSRIEPSEIICNEEMLAESINLSVVKFGAVCPFCSYNETAFDYDNAYKLLHSRLPEQNLQLIKERQCICAAGALLSYINDTQKCAMANMNALVADDGDKRLLIDSNARRTLELTQSLSQGNKRGSLFWCLDKTCTGMGARLLKKWIEGPEIDCEVINSRLDFVEELSEKSVDCRELHEILGCMYDIERLTGRLSSRKMVPVDFLSLGRSLRGVALLKERLADFGGRLAKHIYENLSDFTAECEMIESAIFDKNAKSANPDDDENAEKSKRKSKEEKSKDKNKNKIFKDGYNAQLDEYRNLISNAHTVLKQLVAVEKEETGIKTLRIGFTNVFGYYIEVPKAQADLVPYRYMRKQTVANAERYVTEELKELEEKILNAEELSETLEEELYVELNEKLSQRIAEYLSTAKSVAMLDCLVSFAIVARENGYVKPNITTNDVLNIREGRHPVVERMLRDESFVPNDTFVNSSDSKIMLITGPNMAGKSIYMKQVALITIMAQMGSFIPASSGDIGIVDRIFTRVGASDDLSSGRSTFMVEMSEVTDILNNATDKSLLLMDEIGRGTSTFDGLSIAWAIMEHLSEKVNAKVLFSTHYHELTDLENKLSGIKNYKLTVRELGNSIVFLRKLMRGSANRSFGIEVASLAGLPEIVVKRAKEILKRLEASDLRSETLSDGGKQISLFAPDGKTHEITKILSELDLDYVTPRAALDILTDLKEKAEMR